MSIDTKKVIGKSFELKEQAKTYQLTSNNHFKSHLVLDDQKFLSIDATQIKK